jgi:dTMP kinase
LRHWRTITLISIEFAARREQLMCVIWPALKRGEIVLCEEFSDATYAHRGYGDGVHWPAIETLEYLISGAFTPDITVFLDMPACWIPDRVSPERLDVCSLQFHRRARMGYLARRSKFYQRFLTIDGTECISEVRRNLTQDFGFRAPLPPQRSRGTPSTPPPALLRALPGRGLF